MAKRLYLDGNRFSLKPKATMRELEKGEVAPEPDEVIHLTEGITLYRHYIKGFDETIPEGQKEPLGEFVQELA